MITNPTYNKVNKINKNVTCVLNSEQRVDAKVIVLNDHFFYLTIQGMSIGRASIWRNKENNKICDLQDVFIAPSMRKKDYGKCLIKSIIDFASLQGYEKIALKVQESNTAGRELYKKCGFVELVKFNEIVHTEFALIKK